MCCARSAVDSLQDRNNAMKRPITTTAICLLIGIALAACGNGSKNPGSAAAQPESVPETTTPDAAMAAAIMDKPMDGSSVEAFTRDLDAFKAVASPGDYEALEAALSYLKFYKLGGVAGVAELAQLVDGMTPKEIIASASK
jgi:hypothetical protein